MNWTYETPTKQGWYLGALYGQLPKGVPYLIKRIWVCPDGVHASADLFEDGIFDYRGPWFGPIPYLPEASDGK